MIKNPSRLLENCPPGTHQAHSLRVLEHFLLNPLGEVWDVMVTSAYRSMTQQAGLYALDEARSARKAKGISQHVLGEAIDAVPERKGLTPEQALEECFLWCVEHLRPWQAILEYKGSRPECIHLSIPSERPEIVQKRLLFYDGLWRNYDGTLPGAAV
jgi:hypothetical protein